MNQPWNMIFNKSRYSLLLNLPYYKQHMLTVMEHDEPNLFYEPNIADGAFALNCAIGYKREDGKVFSKYFPEMYILTKEFIDEFIKESREIKE